MLASRQACRIIWGSLASISFPSTVILGIRGGMITGFVRNFTRGGGGGKKKSGAWNKCGAMGLKAAGMRNGCVGMLGTGRWLAAVLVVLVVPIAASALVRMRPTPIRTVEWRVAYSGLIVRGVVTAQAASSGGKRE